MGSWVRTITSPFRKARTILNQQATNTSGSIDEHHHRHRAKKPRRHSSSSSAAGTPSSSSSSSTTTATRTGGDVEEEVVMRRSSQLYGDVMACAYEDVQGHVVYARQQVQALSRRRRRHLLTPAGRPPLTGDPSIHPLHGDRDGDRVHTAIAPSLQICREMQQH
ncbi:hypothetical protein OsJ_17045 [Oryza sativa Japonica Group]|uniref:Uncharacterized protein n=1 Tax=Oryza sativa subsp. japonica TaxID=39947 RepID=B9FMC2_ORYSJ|nr:hypothetical protein OsJ_17045 [Oryza sativa Japonica Group]